MDNMREVLSALQASLHQVDLALVDAKLKGICLEVEISILRAENEALKQRHENPATNAIYNGVDVGKPLTALLGAAKVGSISKETLISRLEALTAAIKGG